ncbi:MAG: hypothetical protein Q7R97_05060 [Candidatus Daviesbacteria bacterium]|nr:hypothetical protein [Candidatus Daviesbacteria bacterium]
MVEINDSSAKNRHTIFLQEASCDLVGQGIKVTQSCIENLQLLSPILSSDLVHGRVKQLIDPHYVPDRALSKWRRKEGWVSKMLIGAKIMSDPKQTDIKLGEQLHPIKQFESVEAALGFFYATEERLRALLDMKITEQLSLRGHGVFAYTESRILRTALVKNVFLTKLKQTTTHLDIYSN